MDGLMHGLSARARRVQCVVCAAALRNVSSGPALQDPYPTCHAVACRMVVSRRADMDEASFRHYLQRTAQQKRKQMALAEVGKVRRQAEFAANTRTWAALHAYARLGSGQAAMPLQLLLPSGPPRARQLPAVRRDHYRNHLLAVTAIAASMAPSTPRVVTDVAPPSALPGRLCALCAGGCCTRGGEHAYLDPATLRRIMDANPQLSPEAVVQAYLDRLADKTQAGSCINHTRSGCSLPRDMRSDTCNDFACEPLAQVQAAPREQVVLVVRRKQQHWLRDRVDLDNAINGAAVLTETGVRRMRIGRQESEHA